MGGGVERRGGREGRKAVLSSRPSASSGGKMPEGDREWLGRIPISSLVLPSHVHSSLTHTPFSPSLPSLPPLSPSLFPFSTSHRLANMSRCGPPSDPSSNLPLFPPPDLPFPTHALGGAVPGERLRRHARTGERRLVRRREGRSWRAQKKEREMLSFSARQRRGGVTGGEVGRARWTARGKRRGGEGGTSHV